MCGIVGCLALAIDADPDQAWVAAAARRITHRGPDDEGFYADHDVALGFRRLAIIDLSQRGHQPMRSADERYWMVFNGENAQLIHLPAHASWLDQGGNLLFRRAAQSPDPQRLHRPGPDPRPPCRVRDPLKRHRPAIHLEFHPHRRQRPATPHRRPRQDQDPRPGSLTTMDPRRTYGPDH